MSALSAFRGATRETLERTQSATKPRLLYVVTRGEHGGAQAHVLDLARGMRERFEVEVATGEEGFLTDACREHGIPVHFVPHLQREIEPLHDVRG